MAIVIPIAMEGLRVANRAGVVAQRKSVATRLADGILSDMVATNGWRNNAMSGDFREYGLDGYHWTMLNEAWTVDVMRRITVDVTYTVQDQEFDVRLSTLVQDTTN